MCSSDLFLLPTVCEFADSLAQGRAAFAQRDLAAEINNCYFADLPACALESHENLTAAILL